MKRTQAGFTIIELLVVMGIIIALMAVAVVVFQPRSDVRLSARAVKTRLDAARAWAVAHRQRTTLAFGNGPDGRAHYVTIDTAGKPLHGTNFLEAGVVFADCSVEQITFKPDQTVAGDAAEYRIGIARSVGGKPQHWELRVAKSTGAVTMREVE